MSLKLIPPRQGRSPHYRVRGTHLGVYLDRSAKTGDRRIAQQQLRRREREIEAGIIVRPSGATFAGAALAYLQSGHERTYLPPLLRYFGETAIERVDQRAVDDAAIALYPKASAATWNRQVYTPVSAVLNHAGHNIRFRRPKASGARTRWATPEQFEMLAANLPGKLRRLAIFLVYGGCRLGEALALDWQTVSLAERIAYIPATKNGLARAVHLTDRMLLELAEIEPKSGRVFGYKNRWSVAHAWRDGANKAGLAWVTPHVLRHTWATWMRRYSGADINTLIATGAWKDMKSVLRYMHVVTAEEAKLADLLPRLDSAKSVEQK